MNAFIESMKVRRTQYSLGKTVALPENEIEHLIKNAVRARARRCRR